MTATIPASAGRIHRETTPTTPPTPTGARLVVVLAVVAVVVIRLPFLNSPLEPDEAGFLTVAAQWHAGGTSLYGDYWVDRPPLLLMLFQFAAALGGTVALRLIGIVAAVIAVVAVARAAKRLVGRRGAAVAAVAAAAWLVSPLTGSLEVDGELLAAPFVALGVSGVVTTLTTRDRSRALRASFGAGMAGAGAVLVKQNMVDVLVFTAVVAALVRIVAVQRAGGRRRPVLAPFMAGGAVTGVAVAAWTVAHGTSLPGVWYAMYPFRAAARAVMSTYPSAAASSRAAHLLAAVVASGLAVAALALFVSLPRLAGSRRQWDAVRLPVGVALMVVLGYDAVSIYLGGNYWMHYLVQAVVPASLALGLVAACRPLSASLIAGLAAVIALGASAVAAEQPTADSGARIGEAIRTVARPSDSIVTAWGDADVTHASGLRSPYPFLWSLPVRTLDPQLRRLTVVLRGDRPPTWFVSTTGPDAYLAGVDTAGLDRVLARRYRVVARQDGTVVFLLDDVHRDAPRLTGSTATTATTAPITSRAIEEPS